MRTTRAMGAAATLFAVVAAAGCSGGSSGGGTSSTASHTAKGIASGESMPPQTSTTSSPSSSASSTSATPTSSGTAAGAPGVPERARQHTKAGAQAFVVHYLNVMNKAAEKPTAKPLAPISEPNCKTCAEWAEVFTTLIKDGTHYDAPVFGIPPKMRPLKIDDSTYHLFFTLKQSAANIRKVQSKAITVRGKTSSMNVVFELNWTNEGWRTGEVQKNEG